MSWLTSPSEQRAALSVSTAGNDAVAAQVQDLFMQAGRQGERAVGVVRLVVAGLALVRHVYFNLDELLRLERKETITGAVITLALLLAIPSLRVPDYRAWERLRSFMLASITVDALVVFGALISLVIWPAPDYRGFLGAPYFSVVFVSIIICGLRLSRWAAVYGTIINLALFATLLALDGARNAAVRNYTAGHVAFVVILIGAAGAVGVVVASRTRALVLESAARMMEAARIRSRLGAYMAREVVEAALQAREMKMGGQRQDVAVLFSDLRGFTAYSERLEPEQLVSQLNAYLEVMVAAIQAEGGVVDKYIGDAIMAVFGAPRTRGDDAARAMRAAARMQQALGEHNRARAARGLPPLEQGIGLHYGPVVAGNVGTLEQAQYTIVGDTVNLASRLESMTKEQKVPVLISQALLDAAAGAETPAVAPCGTVKVRGRETPVAVYTLAPDGRDAARATG
ncbi:MAG: adenylate/guanylate cyclase domain-containing protein [Myxococcota bacterium]